MAESGLLQVVTACSAVPTMDCSPGMNHQRAVEHAARFTSITVNPYMSTPMLFQFSLINNAISVININVKERLGPKQINIYIL